MNQTQRQKKNLAKRSARKKLLKNSGGKGKRLMALYDRKSREEKAAKKDQERKSLEPILK